MRNTPAAPAEMTVSVQVLVVDGNRRMSHRFFAQIQKHEDMVDNAGFPADGVTVWGWTDAEDGDIYVVGVVNGELRREYWGFLWHADAIEEIRHQHRQLFIGG